MYRPRIHNAAFISLRATSAPGDGGERKVYKDSLSDVSIFSAHMDAQEPPRHPQNDQNPQVPC